MEAVIICLTCFIQYYWTERADLIWSLATEMCTIVKDGNFQRCHICEPLLTIPKPQLSLKVCEIKLTLLVIMASRPALAWIYMDSSISRRSSSKHGTIVCCIVINLGRREYNLCMFGNIIETSPRHTQEPRVLHVSNQIWTQN